MLKIEHTEIKNEKNKAWQEVWSCQAAGIPLPIGKSITSDHKQYDKQEHCPDWYTIGHCCGQEPVDGLLDRDLQIA